MGDIFICTYPGEYANRPVVLGQAMPGIFDCRPSALQKQPLLRVHDFRFSWGVLKKGGIKPPDVL
ncbi:hypothetical protein D3C75_1214660 [compost metagenome]